MKTKPILYFLYFFLLLSLSVSALPLGENSEQSCDGSGHCATIIYSYQKYYQEGAQWTPIDENFNTQNCEPDYQYCVDSNLYQVHVKNTYSAPLITYGNTRVSSFLDSVESLPPLTTTTAEMSKNTMTYRNILAGVDLKYTYLPHKIKEEIILKDSTVLATLLNDLDLQFTLTTASSLTSENNMVRAGDFIIRDIVAYDEHDVIPIPFTLNQNILTLHVPYSWIKNESRVYPIIIDPSFELNTSMNQDLYVSKHFTGSTYHRQSSLSTLNVGYERTTSGFPPSVTVKYHRGSFDWDISSIPDNATISKLNLTLYINQTADTFNENLTFGHMEGNSTYYPDQTADCLGNCQYWKDMANGTNYTKIIGLSSSGFVSFDLSNASTDMQSSLSKDAFSIGLANINDVSGPGVNTLEWRFASKEYADADKRPVLKISYSQNGANETDGDSAITLGILNSLPTALIHNEQQVYTRASSSTQQLGRFDRVAVFGNQRWAFNYVTAGESFTNMNNVSNTFFVLELNDLFVNDIIAQVSVFINGTKQ